MKKLILISLAILVANNIIAQTLQLTPVFDQCYNDTFEVGQGRMCKPLLNGNGYVIVGDSRLAVTDGKPHHGTFNFSWNEDAYIAVTDNNFNVIKSNIFGGTTANDDHDYFTDVFPQPDGGFVCYGRANSYDGDIPSPSFALGYGMLLMKVDSNLNLVWSKPYPVPGVVEMSCIQSRDGGFILLGANGIASGDANIDLDGTPFLYDYTVVKTDSAGDKIWAKVYGSSAEEQPFGSIVEDKALNIYICGASNGHDNNCLAKDTTWKNGLNTGNDIFVIKTDSSGNQLWAQSYGGTDPFGSAAELVTAVLYDSLNNEILLGGQTASKDLTFTSAQYLLEDAFFLRIDTSGATIQIKMIGGNNYDVVKSINLGPTPNTNFIGIHTQSNNDGDLMGYVSGGPDFFLCLIDQQNNFVMKYGTAQSSGEGLSYSFYNPAQSEVIVGAHFGALSQLFCDSIQHTTNIYKPGIRRFQFDPVGINDKHKDQLEYTIYPNPTSQLFYIKTLEKIDYDVKIFDLSGKQLTQKTKQESLAGINVAGYASGTYIVLIQSKDFKSYRKLIISP